MIFLHMASVWVPFISESKEAIADYDEIRKEVKLGIAECGRRLAMLLRRKKRKASHVRRRDVFTRYIDEVVEATRSITRINKEDFRRSLIDLSKTFTAQADVEFDDHGQVIKRAHPGNDMGLANTIVVDREEETPEPLALFGGGDASAGKPAGGAATPKKRGPRATKRKR